MRSISAALMIAALALTGCDRPPRAYGEANSIIVLAQDELWQAVRDTVLSSLEPRIFTVRQERMFNVTQVDPSDPTWGRLRQFRQILAFGRPSDPWMQEIAAEADAEMPQPPGIMDARDVWVNEQLVTGVVVPPQGAANAVRELASRLQERFDARFRTYVHQRMFVSGVDQELADSLERIAGFRITVPEIYSVERPADSVFVFRDVGHGQADLRRTFYVSWRSGAQRMLPLEQVLAWRDTLLERYHREDVVPVYDELRIDTVETGGREALELQGVWERPRGPGFWPGGGPFITRVVHCPREDRTYLLDATLYAPGRDKYEYMLQLWTILDSFRC